MLGSPIEKVGQARRQAHRLVTPLVALALGGGCLAASAQTASTEPQKVQLYLAAISGAVPKKGYVEKDATLTSGSKVAFRECATARQILIEKNQLQPIEGTCAGAPKSWPFLGWVTAVKPDGAVAVQMTDGKIMVLTAEDWRKGFLTQPSNTAFKEPPAPQIGEFLGGISYDNPRNLYIIENFRVDRDVKG